MATADGDTGATTEKATTVLRVGDDPDGSPVPAPDLEAGGNLVVSTTKDFAEALDRVSADEVDCVVAVHHENGFDGVALLEAIRRDRPRFPVILVPVDGGDDLAERAVAADVTAYVSPDGAVAERVLERVDDAVPAVGTSSADVRMPIKDRTPAEERRLKERAMDEAPVGITITDGSHPENPLVYVNDAFEEMTGYEKELALGVNCRFLQGRGTDPEKVALLRESVENDDPATVELRNYRKDGTEFWNRLDIQPIFDDEGTVSSYVGFQMDVTKRKRAERQLERERENLRRLLDRIDGLISDVTEVIVRAENRPEIHRMIVDRVASGGEFADAWVGRYDPAGDSVTVEEWSGDASDLSATELSLDSDLTAPRLVGEAIETGQPQVLDRVDVTGSVLSAEDDDYAGWVVVPLTYRSTCYGVMAVYAAEQDVFDDREVEVLEAIGRSIGAAINDVLSKRTMTTDSVIEVGVSIRDENLPLAGLAGDVETELSHEGTHPGTDGELQLLFSADESDGEAVAAAARDQSSIASAESLVADENGCVLQLTMTDSPLIATLSEYGARIETLRVDGSAQEVRFRVADEQNGRAVIDHLEDRYDSVELIAYHESDGPERTRQGFRATMESRLTDRQRTALQKAYVSGFFDWPRRCDGDQLADSMDIVPSTYHQHLRAAQRKLTAAFFEE